QDRPRTRRGVRLVYRMLRLMPTTIGNVGVIPGHTWFGGSEPQGPLGPDCNGRTWYANFSLRHSGPNDTGSYVVAWNGGVPAIVGTPNIILGPLTTGRGTMFLNPVDNKLY